MLPQPRNSACKQPWQSRQSHTTLMVDDVSNPSGRARDKEVPQEGTESHSTSITAGSN